MPDEPTTEMSVPPATEEQGQQNASPGDGGRDAPNYVSQEEFAALQTRLQQQSAMLGKLENALKGLGGGQPVNDPEPPAAGKTEDAKRGKAQAGDDTLARRVQELEQRQEAQRQRAAILAVQGALQNAGVSGDAVADARDLFMLRHDGRVNVDDASLEVTIQEAPETETPVSDYVAAWLKASGSRYLPARKNPSVPGVPTGGSSAGGPQSYGLEDYLAMDDDALRAAAGQRKR